MNHYVYRIVNNINNKQYIGVRKHTNPAADSYMGSGKIILQAIKKYGIQNFTKEIIFTELSMEEAYGVQKFLVDQNYVDRSDTYNIAIGGIGGVRCKITEQSRKKLSQQLNKRWSNPEYRTRCIESMKLAFVGRKATQQTKKILSQAHKGKKQTEQTKLKISNTLNRKIQSGQIIRVSHQAWNKGKKCSQQTKKKISDAKKGKKLSDQTRKKMSQRMKGNTYALKKKVQK